MGKENINASPRNNYQEGKPEIQTPLKAVKKTGKGKVKKNLFKEGTLLKSRRIRFLDRS